MFGIGDDADEIRNSRTGRAGSIRWVHEDQYIRRRKAPAGHRDHASHIRWFRRSTAGENRKGIRMAAWRMHR